VDLEGNLSVWDVEKRLRIKFITSPALENYTKGDDVDVRERDITVVDIAWWDNNSLIIMRRCGSLVVCNIVGRVKNLLGEKPETFPPHSVITPAANGQFFILANKEIKDQREGGEQNRGWFSWGGFYLLLSPQNLTWLFLRFWKR